jgi:DNA-binding SARP family transcriptional activator
MLHVQGSSSEGLEFLCKAEDAFRETGDKYGLANTMVRRSTVYRLLGDYPAALNDANEALHLTESSDEMQTIHAHALRQKGLILFRQGQSRQSVKFLERALESYKSLEDSSHIPILMMETGMAYSALGKEIETIRLNSEALQIWKQKGNLTWQANVLNNIGVLHHLQGEYDKAVLALEEGLLCAQRSGYYVRIEALILISLGDVYAEVEDFNLAHQYYQRGHTIADEIGDQFLLNYLILARAKLFIQQGELERAKQLLDEASRMISSQNSQYEDGMYHLLRGQVFLLESNSEKAKGALDIAESRFENSGHYVEHFKSQFLLAGAYSQDNQRKDAILKLKTVFKKMSQFGHPILVFVQQLRPWLQDMQSDAEIGYDLQKLLDKANKINGELPGIRRRIRRLARVTELPGAKMAIQGFGRAQVKIGEKLLSLSDWQTQSVRDLFFYFMTIEKPLTKEQIGSVFWPDVEEPARLKMRFKNDIYRLRRAVGSEIILYENDLYSFNRALDYEYDVEAFEGFLFQVKLSKEPKIRIELLQSAVNLVRGQFLEDIYANWVIPERERIVQEFLSAILDLAELFKSTNQVQAALNAYQQAIAHSPTFETVYVLAMKLHAQLKDRVGAIRLYDAYIEMMKNELDLPPSPEMEAYYKRLVS